MAASKPPHPAEHPQGASRRPHGVNTIDPITLEVLRNGLESIADAGAARGYA